jgi:2-dehydropantoate 2-reductase
MSVLRIKQTVCDACKGAHDKLACMQEVYAIGRKISITFSFADPVVYVTAFASPLAKARPSMLLDHVAGRRSEIDAINGMVSALGRRHGIATPS